MSDCLEVIVQDFASGFYEVECFCGWEARQQFTTEDEARDAWENHCDAVFFEATERMGDRG